MVDPLVRTDYVFLQEFLRDRIGHELGEGKEYLVESRLGTLGGSRSIDRFSTLFDRLRARRDFDLEDAVCEAMVTCETSFFRNPSAFARLRDFVLPELFRKRVNERQLRIWSAGCSSGQEPYSVAMTLLEHFPQCREWDIRIVATDVSESILRQANEGTYSGVDIRRGLPASLLRAYFVENDGRWSITKEPRRFVQFARYNLISPSPFSTEFDLILLRNVLIYFAAEKRARVFSTMRRSIRSDGFLFLGESETILGQGDEFTFAAEGMDYYRPSSAIA
jgi:chemotaxis protein methyltransferase CheR